MKNRELRMDSPVRVPAGPGGANDRRLAAALCVLVVTLLFPGAAPADEFSLEHKAAITGAGSPNYLAGPASFHISGNYAYVAGNSDDALTVFDISDIANGNITKKAHTSTNRPHSPYVSGNYLYVVQPHNDVMTVFDISDAANGNITHKAAITGAGSPNYLDGARAVLVSGNYAYVTGSFDDALTVFDISDVGNGNITHQAAVTGAGSPYYLDDPWWVSRDGDYVYVASYGDNSLSVFKLLITSTGSGTGDFFLLF